QLRDHRLAEQATADEDRLAVDPCHAAAIVAEVGDVGFERFRRNEVGSGHGHGRWRLAADYHRSAGFTPRDATPRRRLGSTSRREPSRSSPWRRWRESATPTPDGCWPRRFRDTARRDRGSRRPPRRWPARAGSAAPWPRRAWPPCRPG